MEFQDKTLVCKDCGKDFTFTASEQQFYADKGFQNEPSRCPDDRAKHRSERQERPKTEVTCANCGRLTTVPFEPKGDRPVYCLDCFKVQQATGKLPDPKEVNPQGGTSAEEMPEEVEAAAPAESTAEEGTAEAKSDLAEAEEPKAEEAEEVKASESKDEEEMS